MAIATIVVQITTPSDITPPEVNHTLAVYWGYQAQIPDPGNPGQTIPNPESEMMFVRRKTSEFVGQSYTAALANESAEAGRQEGITEAKRVTFEGAPA